MQPYELFTERLIRERIVPEVSAVGDRIDSKPRPRLGKSIAKIRLIVASCATVAMTWLFVGALVAH